MKKLLLVVVLLVLVAGCARNGMKDAYRSYRGYTAEQLYQHAQTAIKKGNYSDAVKFLEASDAMYPFGPYAEQVEVDSIYAYYKHGDDDLALAAADRYLRMYPRGAEVDYVYYMKGMINYGHGFTWLQRKFGSDPAPRDLTDKIEAFRSFNQIVTYFPQSPYASDAACHMNMIRNLLARKDVLIAQYYFDRKAYVAAANRASEVVAHYDCSPEVIPALIIMVKSYRCLGLNDMADSTLRILQLNYKAALPHLHG